MRMRTPHNSAVMVSLCLEHDMPDFMRKLGLSDQPQIVVILKTHVTRCENLLSRSLFRLLSTRRDHDEGMGAVAIGESASSVHLARRIFMVLMRM